MPITLTTRPEEIPDNILFDHWLYDDYHVVQLDNPTRYYLGGCQTSRRRLPDAMNSARNVLFADPKLYWWKYGSHFYHHVLLPYYMAKERGETLHGKLVYHTRNSLTGKIVSIRDGVARVQISPKNTYHVHLEDWKYDHTDNPS